MCRNCEFIGSVFGSAIKDPHRNYSPVLMLLKELEEQGRIELYAGDCPVSEAKEHLERELHYTVCNYFKCKTCEKFIYIGACIRGTPKFKMLETLKEEKFERLLWGQAGTFFRV